MKKQGLKIHTRDNMLFFNNNCIENTYRSRRINNNDIYQPT